MHDKCLQHCKRVDHQNSGSSKGENASLKHTFPPKTLPGNEGGWFILHPQSRPVDPMIITFFESGWQD